MNGTLYLLPVPLGPGAADQVLPASVMLRMRTLRYFVVERPKTARAFLKMVDMPVPIQEIHLEELSEHTPQSHLKTLLSPLLQGEDVGLMSEAGCPAVADPGADLVALAHERQIRVVPMVGPSSLLLALMGSGLNGQRFAFHGYLPTKDEDRCKKIRQLEQESLQHRQTQLFIETPYRNLVLFQALIRHCRPTTRVCLAVDLTLSTESVTTYPVHIWKQRPAPDIDRRPCIFLLLG